DTGIKDTLEHVIVGPKDTLIALGEGRILRSTDAGEHWVTVKNADPTERWEDVIAGPKDTLITVGMNGKIVRSTDAGEHWVAVKDSGTKNWLIQVVTGPKDTVIAVGRGPTIVRSTDAGEHWVTIREEPEPRLMLPPGFSGTFSGRIDTPLLTHVIV